MGIIYTLWSPTFPLNHSLPEIILLVPILSRTILTTKDSCNPYVLLCYAYDQYVQLSWSMHDPHTYILYIPSFPKYKVSFSFL